MLGRVFLIGGCMKPKISVIIPVYNVEKYLDECLSSACIQAPCDIEILCINDSSIDGSQSILDKWQNKDSRVKVLQHDRNLGLSEARNTGLRNAQGEYVLFLDSDDMFAPNIYRMVLKYMSTGIDTLWFNASCLFEFQSIASRFDNFIRWYDVPEIYIQKNSGKKMFTDAVLNRHYRAPVYLYCSRRDFLEFSGLSFYPGILHEDELWTVELFMKCKAMTHIKDKLYVRRFREDSIVTGKYSEKKAKSLLTVINEIIGRIYTEDSEVMRRCHCRNLLFILGKAKKASNVLKHFSEHEKDLFEIAEYSPEWIQRQALERYIHRVCKS